MHLSTIQTLADPSRFRIVELLRAGERAVNDIVHQVDIDQSGVSRHLRILQEAGFVRMRPDGQRRIYSLCPEPFRDLDAWMPHTGSYGRGAWTSSAKPSRASAKPKQRNPESKKTTEEKISMTQTAGTRIVIERAYEASIEDVWELWTTKEGIESWWGPEGFSTKVHELDLRPGGVMRYAMTAVDPAQVAFMKQAGMPLTIEASLTYIEIVPGQSIAWLHKVDFVPGVAPYDAGSKVEFFPEGKAVRMVVTLDPMHSDEWTQRSVMGWESQLRKLAPVIAVRHGK